MTRFSSEFRKRLWLMHHVGSIQRQNGQYLSIPLYHRRPPEPFRERLTRAERIRLRNWFETIEKV